MMPCGRGASGGGAYFAPTAVRPGLSAREAGVTPALARPHDQVYFHLPLSIAPFVWRQDVALSRRKQGFESPRERQCFQRFRPDFPLRVIAYGKNTASIVLAYNSSFES